MGSVRRDDPCRCGGVGERSPASDGVSRACGLAVSRPQLRVDVALSSAGRTLVRWRPQYGASHVSSDPIVGIDLGTSNSVVAYADVGGQAKVLADEAGYKIHPSVVSFHPSGGVVVGAAAKQRKVIDPANTIYSAKRLIGRSFRAAEVQTAKARMPYKITEGANQLPMITTRGGEFAVPEIS